MSCIRCGAATIPNPIHTHWRHCQACEPAWVEYIADLNRLTYLDTFARFAASDARGRPTIGGSRV